MSTGKPIEAEVNNCNNVVSATIQLRENHLNIRYAMNGTGKSTISSAIDYFVNNKPLSLLQPFGSDSTPSCKLTGDCKSIQVFNEEYVNSIVFQQNEVIPNSYDIFIKSSQYEEKQASINKKLSEIHIDFSKNEDLSELFEICRTIIDKFPVTTTGTLRESGTLKTLTKSLSPSLLPKELKKFKPLMEKDYTINWVAWKHEGSKYDDNNICPFCTSDLDTEYDNQKTKFNSSYAKADVRNRFEMLALFHSIEGFMEEEAKQKLLQCIKGLQTETDVKLWINSFRIELVFLIESISKLENFNTYQVRINDISKLEEQLTNLIVNISGLKIFKSERIETLFKSINEKIKVLQKETESIKKEIGELTSMLVSTCKNTCVDINNFLTTAGIDYLFEIIPESEGKSRTILKYHSNTGDSIDVDEIRSHLSWGERNAFALVLFMFEALSKKPDLIILDDPISSFDSNKKFAIINRLFSSTDASFKDKTVLMLTHDLQPIIDFIKVNKPKNVPISAYYLKNKNGTISEHEILNDDIKSFPKLLSENSKNTKINIVHRVASLRKLVEHSPDTTEKTKSAYHILSSLLHGKPEPDNGDNTPKLTAEEITSGEEFIKNYIDDFNYDHYIKNIFTKENLSKYFKDEENPYIKLQIFRVLVEVTNLRTRIEDNPLVKYIDEQFHVENDYMFSLDLLKFDIVPDFVIPKCDRFLKDEHICS